MTKKAKIIATGSYLPEKILTNLDLEKMVETSDEWIVTRTGIKERRLAKNDEFASDLGYNAAMRALEEANLSANDIGLIMVATLTPDYVFPSTACLIQQKLKAYNAAAVDFQAACSGFLYGLSIAKALVEGGVHKNVLLIATEKLSSITNYEDRSTCVLFGDGASACIIGSEGLGYDIQAVILGADGEQSNLLLMPAGGCRNPASINTVEQKMHYIQMSGNAIFKHAVRRMENASKECLDQLNLKEEDISWLIPHQANGRIISAIAKKFDHLPNDRVYKDVVEKYGNTSASSVGIALDDLNKRKIIKHGENILLTAFGAGLTWGSAIITKNDGLGVYE